ncbi:MAG: hypothetical protein KJ069_15450 [Anaerolineae bacterium]|nr:hypothetical protein [Anaerolineae bacterium]
MKVRLFISLALFTAVLLLVVAHVSAKTTADEPIVTGGDTPVTLVPENVAESTVQNAKVWWWYQLSCAPTATDASGMYRMVEIARIATTGGITRTVFVEDTENPYCNSYDPELLSNVTADDDYLYWMSYAGSGLVRLSVEANVGDTPELVYGGQTVADEIEERGNYVYLMDDAYGIIRVNKTTGIGSTIVTAGQLGGFSRDLQATDEYVFWNQGGDLTIAYNSGGGGDGITTGVTGYIAENSLCPPGGPCPSTEYVFLAQGEQIRRYNVDTQTFSSVIYDSPVTGASVVEMTVDSSRIYFYEQREAGCNPFCTYNYGLYRINRTAVFGTADLLYYISDDLFGNNTFDLTLGGPDNDYLFWHDQGALKRLPRDAAAIPSIDIAITDVEVTQAIQDLNDSVQLVRDKRTGVRVHVDAAGQNVPGISARLYRINSVGTILAGPIYPSGGTHHLTVPNTPDRANFNHAFYFELPNSWIGGTNVRLRAEVNYTQIPPEPNFANNNMNTGIYTFRASPTLRTHLLVWGYTVDGDYYQPGTWQDVNQARSWIRRTYPLASTPGGYESPDPGFRLKVRTINDPNLGGHVQRTSDFCLDIPEEDREFCAATYTNNCAQWLRATEGIPNDEMIYSMIWDEPSLPFPRGFATGNVSAGPTGTGTWGWDTDGSYGDWYMGHEVGHNAGRGHPSQGNSCGHSASDPNFPYTGAAIGTGSMWGFDVGDIGLNSVLTPRVYPNSTWRDMMSYCDRQWISDYTYNGIYDFLSSQQLAPETAKPQPVRAGTDTIALFGTIYDDSDVANFQVVGLWDSAGPYTPPVGGAYRMRLLGSGGNQLASYDFDGDASDANPSNLGFAVVVPFPLDTTSVELSRISDGLVLATHQISANAPTISNVELVGASNPVTGTATLQWQASDADGDPLMFDVYYTDDNGATYTAYALALMTSSVQLDTNQMGGSTQARFRVTANDGTRLAEAESANFAMANKPATITMLTPQDGLEVTYGTAVNFIAEVEDLQGHVPDGNMGWYVNGSPTFVTGPFYTAYLLPVGVNVVSLRATNSQGQLTIKSVTVIVNDDLDYPGPLLGVGPDQAGWQVAAGTVTPQQSTLSISNIGTGSLNWTASENAHWLTLSADNGSTPATLTLTADPTLVPEGLPMETMLTISGDNGQTAQIPVSLTVGPNPVWIPGSYSIFLPVIVR